ncbi:MAG: hypothetical protein EA423_02340 [Phycisphaerales bacterium]|nr:MAG: hypothetical protein EA423_02340 [Phycisphaerales bacterium]
MVSSKSVFAGLAGSIVLCGAASARPVMIEMLVSGEFHSVDPNHQLLGPFASVYEGQRWSARYVFPADVSRTFGNDNSSIWVNALDPITFSFDGGEPIVIEPETNGVVPETDLATNHHSLRDSVLSRFGMRTSDGRINSLTLRADAPGGSIFGQVSELNSTDLVGLELSDFTSAELYTSGLGGTQPFRGTVDSFLIRFDPDSVVPAPGAASLLALAGLGAVRRRRA